MHELAAVGRPDLPVKQARQRWTAYVDCEAGLDLLDGDALLHTDFNPLNVLLGPDRVWIIDWVWPTRGAAFIDAACLLIRAMAASSRLYDEIIRNDPQPFKQRLAAVTRDWACHRVGGSVSPTGRRLGSGGSC
jgi:thiamine kinase-like enzyme